MMMDMYYDGKASNFIRISINDQSQGLPSPPMRQSSETLTLTVSS